MNKITYPVLLKKAGLMSQIMNTASFEAQSFQIQAVNLHISILKSGLQLRSAFSNLESLGAVDERIRRDKQKSRMVAVLQAHSQLKSHMAKLEELIDQKIRKADGAEREQVDDLSVDLLGLESGGPFQSILESEMVYDTLSRHFVLHAEALNNHSKRIENSLTQADWKATLVSSDSIEKILEAGGKLLKIELKAVAFKSALENLEQETLE